MSRQSGFVVLLLLPLAGASACAGEDDASVDPADTTAASELADRGAHARPCGSVDEFPRPNIGAQDIVAGSDGNLWYATGDLFLGRVSTRDGGVTLFPIPSAVSQGRLAAGPDGNIWFMTTTGVSAFSPRRHTVRDVPIADLGFAADLTAGHDGAIWVLASLSVFRVTVHGHVTAFPIPTESLNGSHIAPGGDGNVWFNGGGLYGLHAINRITRTGVITRFPVDTPGFPYGLTEGFDGALWFTANGANPGENNIGRMTTDGIASVVVQLPDNTSPPSETPTDMPLEIARGPGDSVVWTTYLVEPLNYIGRTNRRAALMKYDVLTPGAASFGITSGPDGNVWFTENFNALIGRVNLASCHHHGGRDDPHR